MKFRKSMLSASIATALLFAAAAQARSAAPQDQATATNQQDTQTANDQQQPPPQEPSSTHTLQAVQVVGFRASLMKSLETKRAANAIVDAVTAEDIGKFPNTNVAEAMALVPGVTIDRPLRPGRARQHQWHRSQPQPVVP